MSSVDSHKFNDDLLLGENDRKIAFANYASVYHVLDFPELRALFSIHNEAANRAKRKGRIAGVSAILFGFLALAIASLEQFLSFSNTEPLHSSVNGIHSLAIISAVCGLLSAIIGGMGVLTAGRKREWLHQRFLGERIRQFHFQTFSSRIVDILNSLKDEESKQRFLRARSAWLETFKSQVISHLGAQFVATVETPSPTHILHNKAGSFKRQDQTEQLNSLFDAYRELRISHQITYVNHKLQDDGRMFSEMPLRQALVLSNAGLVCLIVLALIDASALLGVFFPKATWIPFNPSVSYLIAIWIALLAMAIRAFEQGLQPEREAERYQHYRSALQTILLRYDQASSQTEKLSVMEEMERLSFDEMKNFLISNNRSRFVM